MKVLQIITSLSTGGAEKLVLDSVPFYQKKGINVDVVTLKDEETPFRSSLIKQSNTTVKGLTKGSVYNPFLIWKIIPLLRKYDLVHLHLFPTLYWVVLAKYFSFSKVKLIYTEHSTHNKRRESTLFKILDKIIYNGLDKIVTISDEVDVNIKKHLKSKDDRFILINNGIDLDNYKNAIPLEKNIFFDEKDFVLMQVSSFRAQKDQPTLIKALQYLPTNFKLLLVGEGPLRDNCESLVNELNIQDRVKFLGIRMDVYQLFKSVDFNVLSSHYEGFGLVAVEGMASGKPFIASEVPGLREIVKNYGLVFEQGNSRELADLILELHNNPTLYQEVVENCQKRATDFDIKKMIEAYVKLYMSI